MIGGLLELGSTLTLALFAGQASPAVSPTASISGERVFSRCYACHSLEAGETDMEGPNLDRIVGRPVASDAAFTYSDALRGFAKLHPKWTPQLLDAFVAAPHQLVPGNAMGFVGIKNEQERAALIVYLKADR